MSGTERIHPRLEQVLLGVLEQVGLSYRDQETIAEERALAIAAFTPAFSQLKRRVVGSEIDYAGPRRMRRKNDPETLDAAITMMAEVIAEREA